MPPKAQDSASMFRSKQCYWIHVSDLNFTSPIRAVTTSQRLLEVSWSIHNMRQNCFSLSWEAIVLNVRQGSVVTAGDDCCCCFSWNSIFWRRIRRWIFIVAISLSTIWSSSKSTKRSMRSSQVMEWQQFHAGHEHNEISRWCLWHYNRLSWWLHIPIHKIRRRHIFWLRK